MSMSRTLATLLVAALLPLGACNKQRPLHVVLRNGDIAAEHGQHEVAVKEYGEFIERRPEASEVRYKLAKSLTASGHPRQAIEQLNVALDVEPLHDDYLDALAEAMYAANERDALTALLARAASERGRVRDYLRQGVYSSKLGNADEAQQSLLTAAKLDQGMSVAPQKALADFYGQMGDRQRQVRRLRMAYFLDPDNKEVNADIRRLGEVPGPTLGLRPEEMSLAAVPESK